MLIILRLYHLVTLTLKMYEGQTFVSRHVLHVLPSSGWVMEHQRLLILPSVSGPGELHRQDDGPGREPARPQQARHAGTHAQVTAWETICRGHICTPPALAWAPAWFPFKAVVYACCALNHHRRCFVDLCVQGHLFSVSHQSLMTSFIQREHKEPRLQAPRL